MSSLSVQVSFQLLKGTLMKFWHPRSVRIYFLRCHDPHILQYDEDPTVENFMGTWARIIPLTFPPHIYVT